MSGIRNRIKNNVLSGTFRRSRNILLPHQRKTALFLAIGAVFSAAFDVLGLAAIVPVMLSAQNPNIVQENSLLNWLYDSLGFTYDGFMIFMVILLLGVFLFKNGFAIMINYLQSRFAFSVATNVADRQYKKYYLRGYTFLKDTNSADIVNNIINVPIFFANGILLPLMIFFTEILVVTFIVIGIAIVDVSLLIAVAAVLVPAFFILYNGTKKRLYIIGKENTFMRGQAMAHLNQSIFGYIDVMLHNKEEVFLDNYIKRQKILNRNSKIQFLFGLLPSRSLEVMAVLSIVVIFLYTFLFVDDRAQLINFVGIFAVAAFRVIPSSNRLLSTLMTIKTHLFALDIIQEGMLPEDFEPLPKNPIELKEKLSFQDLSYTYPDSDKPAVDGLSFEVRKGEMLGIIGESGSGKSTLMNILLRFLEEDSGNILVDGVPLTKEDTKRWRAIMGYVQQNVYLIDASLKENIAFGIPVDKIDEEKLIQSLEQASLYTFVKSLPQGWDTPVGEMGGKLSGGQKQRIGLARALYSNSEILVLDEATSALDMETEKLITESIEKLAQSDKTLFIIAHRITTLKDCDRIMELKDGKLKGFYKYEDLQERLL